MTTPIPAIRGAPKEIQGALEALKINVEELSGQRGDPLDQALTLRMALNSGAISVKVNGKPVSGTRGASGAVSISSGNEPRTDYAIPPSPTGLTVSGGLGVIFLSWSSPAYSNFAYYEVYRAYDNNLSNAIKIGQTTFSLYSDTVGSGDAFYYWVRIVSQSSPPTFGPFNDAQGTKGQAGTDPAYVLSTLTGAITETELYAALNTRLNNIETHTAQISNLNGQYTVKIDVNGYVAGFGLANNGVTSGSDFMVLADRFSIVAGGTPKTVSSITRSGATATAMCTAHGFTTGKRASISGATQAEYNGTFVISVVDANTFTYTVSGTPATPATGTIKAQSSNVPFVVGTVDGVTQVGITSAAIFDASITDAKIDTLAAGKITAGTITATIELTAATITGGLVRTSSGTGVRVEMASSGLLLWAGTGATKTQANGLFSFTDTGAFQLRKSDGTLLFSVDGTGEVIANANEGAAIKLFRLIANGYVSGHPLSSGLYNHANTLISGATRGYAVSVYSRATGAWLSHTVYDVYGSAANAATMAAALNALGSDKIVVIISSDEPQANRTTNGLPAAIYRCGGSKSIFESSNFKYRSAYVLAGVPGCGEGNGIEFYRGDVDSDTNAWIDATISIKNGNLVSPRINSQAYKELEGGIDLGVGYLKNAETINLDFSNKAISINSPTFGSAGIQLQYNAGTPRSYIGNGSQKYMQFDGTDFKLGRDVILRGTYSYNDSALYFHEPWRSFDAYTTSSAADGLAPALLKHEYARLEINVGTNASPSLSGVSVRLSSDYRLSHISFGAYIRMKLRHYAQLDNVNCEFYFGINDSVGRCVRFLVNKDGTGTRFGIMVSPDGTNFYSTLASGTYETSLRSIELIFNPALKVELFVNGTSVVSTTTNLPSSTGSYVSATHQLTDGTSGSKGDSFVVIGEYKIERVAD